MPDPDQPFLSDKEGIKVVSPIRRRAMGQVPCCLRPRHRPKTIHLSRHDWRRLLSYEAQPDQIMAAITDKSCPRCPAKYSKAPSVLDLDMGYNENGSCFGGICNNCDFSF